MKMQHLAIAWLLAACSALLCSCGDSGRGHATQQAAQELADIREIELPALAEQDIVEPELLEMFCGTVDHFLSTSDTRYTSPDMPFSILHLACLFKKPELVRCLLIDGAEPNRHTPDGDSPLLLAVGTFLNPDTPTETITALVDTLLAGGAQFSKSGHTETDFLTQAAFLCENEDVILHLIDKGAAPDADSTLPPALHGWVRTLTRLLTEQAPAPELMHAAAVGSARFSGSYIECIDLLMAHGAKASDTEEGQPGATPLFRLAEELSATEEDDPLLPQALDVFVYLLQHGADAYLRAEQDENYPGFCPYDFLLMRPHLLAKLAERGIELQQPALSFSAGVPLLSELCRAVLSRHSSDELAPHYHSISTILTPSAEMLGNDMYTHALDAALRLLEQIDPAKAAADIVAMPAWQQSDDDALSILSPLIAILMDRKQIVLPKDFLCTQAERLMEAGRANEAASLVELLERCPDASAELARYCADERKPIQAGAYAARLYIEGLPDARNNGVAAWLLAHNRQADTPFLREAVLLTSLESLWFGDMPEQDRQAMFAIMRRVGAPGAAEAYEHISRHLHDPDEMEDMLTRENKLDWKYELEIATARYFLEHKDAFADTPS